MCSRFPIRGLWRFIKEEEHHFLVERDDGLRKWFNKERASYDLKSSEMQHSPLFFGGRRGTRYCRTSYHFVLVSVCLC